MNPASKSPRTSWRASRRSSKPRARRCRTRYVRALPVLPQGACSPATCSANASVCTNCGYHFRMSARERHEADLRRRAASARRARRCARKTASISPATTRSSPRPPPNRGEREGVVTGTAAVGGLPCACLRNGAAFHDGLHGHASSAKRSPRLFELAAEQSLPVVGYTVSGGARMQEGILSLMQMAKTTAAVKRHCDAGQSVYRRPHRPDHRRA